MESAIKRRVRVVMSWGSSAVVLFFFCLVSHHREECHGQHRQGDVPVPGVIETDLVVVQPGLILGRFKTFLDRPAGTDDTDKFCQRFSARVVAVEVAEFSV
ncbi:hypothetical protein [Amycolatopsis sp. NPDC051371]|uniref:hypothetical protein n=1 Tax=Amycolatopsis sp. NPDC051371 TaxID=3155800 RepID=UPI0034232C6E